MRPARASARRPGLNIRPLLANPQARWDHAAVTTFHKDNHSIRSETWRYIRYADGGEELYNHDQDPYEWTNLANDPRYAAVKVELGRFAPTVNVAERPRTLGEGEKDKAGTVRKQGAAKKAKKNAKQQ